MFNKGVGLDRGVGGGGKFYEWTGKRMREGKSSKLSSKKGASVSKFTLIKLFLTGEDLFILLPCQKFRLFFICIHKFPQNMFVVF